MGEYKNIKQAAIIHIENTISHIKPGKWHIYRAFLSEIYFARTIGLVNSDQSDEYTKRAQQNMGIYFPRKYGQAT